MVISQGRINTVQLAKVIKDTLTESDHYATTIKIGINPTKLTNETKVQDSSHRPRINTRVGKDHTEINKNLKENIAEVDDEICDSLEKILHSLEMGKVDPLETINQELYETLCQSFKTSSGQSPEGENPLACKELTILRQTKGKATKLIRILKKLEGSPEGTPTKTTKQRLNKGLSLINHIHWFLKSRNVAPTLLPNKLYLNAKQTSERSSYGHKNSRS